MFKKWNRILAFLLSIALVTTTFGSDFASAKVYAEENGIVEESDETEEPEEPEEPKEETTIADLSSAEAIPQDELGGGNGEGSGNSENDGEGTTPVVTSTEGNGEGTPTPGDPVNTTDEPEYELDENGNPVLDENGNPKLKEKVAEDETEEEVVETEEEVDGIKIYYVVSDEDAGSVSKQREVFAENVELEGSTAEAFDGYKFVNWTDEDGNEVCDEPNFTPSASDLGVSGEGEESEEEVKEITFTANFEEKVTWNQEFNQSKTIDEDGIIVSLYAEPNVLPDDAELRVTKITGSLEDDLENAVEADTDSTEELVATYSYDITIYSPSLGEVQPVDGKVSIQFSGIEEGKEDDTTISVYHAEEEDGEITGFDKIGFDDKKTSSIEVLSDSFSPYTVAITVKASNTQNTTFYAKIVDENYNEISGIVEYTVPSLTNNKTNFDVSALTIGDVTDSKGNVYEFSKAQVYKYNWYRDVTGFSVSYSGNSNNRKYYVNAIHQYGPTDVSSQDNTQLYFVYTKKADGIEVHMVDEDGEPVGTGAGTVTFPEKKEYLVEDVAPAIEGYSFVKATYTFPNDITEYDLDNFYYYEGLLCVEINESRKYYYYRESATVKFYYESANAVAKKNVEWYVGGEKVKTTKVAVGEMPSFGGTPERSSGNLNFDFEGWVTSADYGSSTTRYNNDSIPVVKETDETLKYYAVFSVRTYFYYLLPGKSYTSNSPSDYMHAGIGKVIVPDGISGRWYRDKHDLEKYVMDMPTDSAIRTGISTYYNGTHGRDKYQSDWTYSLTMQTLSFNNTAVGYDEKTIDNGNTLHMDCILTLDTTAKATITYVVNNYPDGNHKGSTISQPVMHVKNTRVEINSTVRSSGSFTTDTLKLNAEETVDGVRCKFDGWYTDETYTTKAPDRVTVTGTITYYARYVGKTYNITYVYNDGTDRTTSATATAGTQATVINDPTWVGHAFKGWTTSFDSNTYYQGNKFTMPSQNVTLTAQWESSNFKVKYQYTGDVPADATDLPDDASVAYGTQNVAVAADATAEGYTFSGWSTQDATVTGGRFTMPANEVVFTGS
ncbi:MAG: InlB B-repeat-containing protein, partial [Butyrivibrio sp.]|uniref:InlB B-repeat-containing protein n=1 Tax=Butyrivibrio sp. TaxID=28121 RepID=UPI001B739ED1